MTITISVTIIAGSSYIACISERYPKISQHLDTIAGVLLIAGLAFVGTSRALIY